MTTISLASILEQTYLEPVIVHALRLLSHDEIFVLMEVEIQLPGEAKSKTLVRVVRSDNPIAQE